MVLLALVVLHTGVCIQVALCPQPLLVTKLVQPSFEKPGRKHPRVVVVQGITQCNDNAPVSSSAAASAAATRTRTGLVITTATTEGSAAATTEASAAAVQVINIRDGKQTWDESFMITEP